MEGTPSCSNDRGARRVILGEDVTEGLARGALKFDKAVVPVETDPPITGEERISKSDLYYQIAQEALKIHDKLVAAGEEIPHAAEIRAHLLRVIAESAQPWHKEKE